MHCRLIKKGVIKRTKDAIKTLMIESCGRSKKNN